MSVNGVKTGTKTGETGTLSPAVRHAIRFTDTYRRHKNSHPAIREAACLAAQFPAVLSRIKPGEMFAGGHIRERIVYMGTIWWTTMPERNGPGKQGGYCFDFSAIKKYNGSDADREAMAALDAFWSRECTWSRISRSRHEEARRALCGRPVDGSGSGFVVALELDRLLWLGIPGMAAVVRKRIQQARKTGETDKIEFLSGLSAVIKILTGICRHYERQAKILASDAVTGTERLRLQRIAGALAALTRRPPETLFEAIQLWWLYSVLACGLHIEGWRIDVAFGDFYAADIAGGRTTEEEALETVCGLWRMFAQHSDPAVSRVIIGGRGRRNERNADRFCHAAMEATKRLCQVIPQLTLRFHDGQDPALLKKAYDVIGQGCTYPMLYNDDVNIPGAAKALHVTETDATRYYPLGCGEYMIGGASPSLLTLSWSVPKSLEAALFGGRGMRDEELGVPGPVTFSTFDDLWAALKIQLASGAEQGAGFVARNLAFAPGDASFLLASLFTDDCVEQGRAILSGGARYVGSCIMAHGITNAADALTAIKTLVFDSGSVTLDEIRDAVKNNFAGHERLHKRMAASPKFGNDNAAADEMLVRLWQELSHLADVAGQRHGLGFFTVSSVNPGGYFLGASCGATADGRMANAPFAIGNAPTAGADTSGITAFLNSVSKVDPVNGGATTNIKLAKPLFTANRPKLELLMSAFWKHGGMQATLTVINQEDLTNALACPECYPNLLVRLGGWTARFTDLQKEIQREIIERTIYS